LTEAEIEYEYKKATGPMIMETCRQKNPHAVLNAVVLEQVAFMNYRA
jgi:hypothetical protein